VQADSAPGHGALDRLVILHEPVRHVVALSLVSGPAIVVAPTLTLRRGSVGVPRSFAQRHADACFVCVACLRLGRYRF
jgi:hypothetical protein